MKVLFFDAVTERPKPVMAQAWRTLGPFQRFLGQAIHTAKQRQSRYQLPWERVRHLTTIRLEPVDSVLRVPRARPGVVLANWPAKKAPDFAQFGFVLDRAVPVRVQAAHMTAAGLRVSTDETLLAGERLLWCGLHCEVRREADPPPPTKVADLRGRALTLRGEPRTVGEDHWILVLEGEHGDCELLVDGEKVEAERMPHREGLRCVTDAEDRTFEVSAGGLRVEEPPADGLLRGDDGVRYRWYAEGGERRGHWIQLLPPEKLDADDFLDPRAAFCEGEAGDVWTQPRRHPDSTFRVKKVDPDRYQLLLDRLPPEGTTLYLPVDVRNLLLQKRALRQLAEGPLPHHRGLLRLCEDPGHARWPEVRPAVVEVWRALTDAQRSGTEEQRAFVRRALGTPDFAFLEGPPGSGKTTAICEIVQQLVEQGQRVLLCASTHVAIDNVLERLIGSDSPIDAVRIGKVDKVDDKVQATQLDERVTALLEAWRAQPAMRGYGDGERREMAERTVIMAANLTCGTTMGIVNHPLFRGRDEDLHVSERPITTFPHWDVLIVDEASKTLIQEFLVPALMAKRWIIVGDVRQLPPFADRGDIVANLRDLVDENDRPVFPPDHQRACLLRFRLVRRRLRQEAMRWLLLERPGVLEWMARELAAQPEPDLATVRVAARGATSGGAIDVVTPQQLGSGRPEALRAAAADWVLVGEDLLPEVSGLLPANVLFAREPPLPEGNALRTRQQWWLAQSGRLPTSYKERRDTITTFAECEAHEAGWLSRHDLAGELAWRLTRVHELRHSHDDGERERIRKELEWLKPQAADIGESIAEIEDIGLPSILEVLQEGIGVERANRPSALTAGLRASRPDVFAARFGSLRFQHRMHPHISSFPRELIYAGRALEDANTIAHRDADLGWDFHASERREWAHVAGDEHGGVNQDEVDVVAGLVREFIAWARRKGAPKRRGPPLWEVACLCFYVKQEGALSERLKSVTGDHRKTRFIVRDAPVEIVCGTVDRFQGREADLVALSMRNTSRVGFLDSPNRLNVAVTRARQKLVIVGRANYFADCGIAELEQLAKKTRRVDDALVARWKRESR